MSGLINNMAAPVVPIMLARQVPRAKIPVFKVGEPLKVPFTHIPPAAVNRVASRMMKGT